MPTTTLPPSFETVLSTWRMADVPAYRPDRIAEALHLSRVDLAAFAGVDRGTLATTPLNTRLQRSLRDIVRVLSAASAVSGSAEAAIAWFLTTPLPPFGHRRAFDVLADGRVDDLVTYLDMIAGGATG
jgi:uncharacterized protein (DUF2384 family)